MADTDQDKKDNRMSAPTKLSLTKTVEGGKVKQNFQHGRSKTVTVEVRKTRTFSQGKDGSVVEVKRPGALSMPMKEAAQPTRHEESLHNLTTDERQARMRALKIAEEETRIAAKEAQRRGHERPRDISVTEEAPSPQSSAPAERDAVTTAPAREREYPQDLGRAATTRKPDVVTPNRQFKAPETVVAPGEEAKTDKDAKPPKMRLRRDEARRASGKITVTQALSLGEERMRSLASVRRQREKAKKGEHQTSSEKIIRDVVIPETLTVQELANRMAERGVDVVKALMKLGVMATVNQAIDADTAELIVTEFGHNMKRVTEGDVENVLREELEDPENLLPRPPVVTIMGHVDHGKTSLLDALRQTDVVAGEAGGITQHIGAYQVQVPSGSKITFLDTPGHEAFTAMRARGAKVTDIVVLVVAADDGIMAQTKEAISHAKAAEVPIIVAINKIDKPDADASRVKNELMQYELVPEEFGGNVMTVEVSAKQKLNLDKLEEAILLQAEVMELKANPARSAAGSVVEAKIDKGRGVVATLLVQRGTLKTGDIVVAGAAYGKVRALTDDKGKILQEAVPAQPVEILGLNSVPDAGDEFAVVENEKTARDITEYRHNRVKAQQTVLAARTVDNLFAGAGKDAVKEMPLIIKGDVQGSVEAIIGSVNKFASEEVSVRVLHSGVGALNESDISLAQATGAMVVGFNVRATSQARNLADREKVQIRYYSVIYDVIDDVKAALSGMLSPTQREKFLGYAEIRQVFSVTKAGKVAGCMVTEGMVKRGAKVRLLRDNVVIHEGTLKTLKRFKDEVKEVKSGFECGMAFENYDDIREGDMIEAFEVEEVARTI